MTSRGVKYVSKDDEEKTKLLSDDIFQDEYEVWIWKITEMKNMRKRFLKLVFLGAIYKRFLRVKEKDTKIIWWAICINRGRWYTSVSSFRPMCRNRGKKFDKCYDYLFRIFCSNLFSRKNFSTISYRFNLVIL